MPAPAVLTWGTPPLAPPRPRLPLLAADANEDRTVELAEFVEGSQCVSMALMSGFYRGSSYTYKAAMARALASRSWRHTLEEAASWEGKVKNLEDIKSQRGPKLEMFANPACDYGIEVRIHPRCLTEQNKHKWIEVSTVTESVVDSFEDDSDRMGVSPLPCTC
jgi:hypothetical protein